MGSYNSINFTKLIVNGIPYNKAYMGSKILFENNNPFTIEFLEDDTQLTFWRQSNTNRKTAATVQGFYTDGSGSYTFTTNQLNAQTFNVNTKFNRGDKIRPSVTYTDLTVQTASNFISYVKILCDKAFKVYGNITTWNDYCMGLFSHSTYGVNLTDASGLVIPDTLTYPRQFAYMFARCSSLQNSCIPEFPATTLTNECYRALFVNCDQITELTIPASDFTPTNCCLDMITTTATGTTGTLYLPYDNNYPTGNISWLPSNWTIQPIITDYSQEYFTIKSLEDNNTITFTKYNQNSSYITADKPIQYSKDLTTWNSISFVTDTSSQIVLNNGEKLYLKGNNSAYGEGLYYGSYLSAANILSSGNIDVMGNIMSLIYEDNFINNNTIKSYAFPALFYNNNKLVNAKNLILPAITATRECYKVMFMGCTSLVTAPELPATTLALQCYYTMFMGCTSLVTAPELPATTLTNYCYYQMFRNCSLLNYVKAMFYFKQGESTNSNNVKNWLQGVSATGTFVKNTKANWDNTTWGIPSGWTVETASE